MDRDKVAKLIGLEFGLACVNIPDTGYIWNAPAGVYGEELHNLKIRIEQRVRELEILPDKQEGCPFALCDQVILRDEIDSARWGNVVRFDGSGFVGVRWNYNGRTSLPLHSVKDLMLYEDWKKQRLTVSNWWNLSAGDRARLRDGRARLREGKQ